MEKIEDKQKLKELAEKIREQKPSYKEGLTKEEIEYFKLKLGDE